MINRERFKPRCQAKNASGGMCLDNAVQRIVKPGIMVSHRCEKHRMDKRTAKQLQWNTFDLDKEVEAS